MTRRFVIVAVASLFFLQVGCGSADAGQFSDSLGNASVTRQSAATSTPTAATLAPTRAAGTRAQPQASSKGKPMNRTAIEQAVVADLVRYLKADAKQIKVIETAERTWPDQGLGCNTRQGVFEPAPTPGYLIKLKHKNETYSYHTDMKGRFLRCATLGKPKGPIMR